MKGREYDIEIQRADKGAEPKRARYNSALMDANALNPGEDIDKLRDTYVIFITEKDVMKKGLDVYSFDRVDKNAGLDLGDGTHIIYVNGATRSATEIGKLVHDLRCREASEMYFDVLKKQVSQFKNSEEGRLTMCKTMEELGARREARGEARGKRKTSPSCAHGFLMCSAHWKVVGAGVVIQLPPYLYKCGGTEGGMWRRKSCLYNRAVVRLI